MTSSDKDFRFMATNDLMSELQKDSIKLVITFSISNLERELLMTFA
jgi:hypothetical protein